MKIKEPIMPPESERRLLHDLFHETKNPIQVIYSASRLLEGRLSCKRRSELCEAIRENAGKINLILNLFADIELNLPDQKTELDTFNRGLNEENRKF